MLNFASRFCPSQRSSSMGRIFPLAPIATSWKLSSRDLLQHHQRMQKFLYFRCNLSVTARNIGEAVAESGFRTLAIVNSHGGQPQIVDIVARRLRVEFQMLVGRINTFLLGLPVGLFSEDELSFGLHGGEVETSMMLSIAPELVDMNAAKNFSSLAARLAKDNKSLRAEGGAAFAWQAQDLNTEGVTGNAAAADAKRGAVALDHIAAQLGLALDDLAVFDWSQLREGPQ
jgi:creatinine amidohydrolase